MGCNASTHLPDAAPAPMKREPCGSVCLSDGTDEPLLSPEFSAASTEDATPERYPVLTPILTASGDPPAGDQSLGEPDACSSDATRDAPLPLNPFDDPYNWHARVGLLRASGTCAFSLADPTHGVPDDIYVQKVQVFEGHRVQYYFKHPGLPAYLVKDCGGRGQMLWAYLDQELQHEANQGGLLTEFTAWCMSRFGRDGRVGTEGLAVLGSRLGVARPLEPVMTIGYDALSARAGLSEPELALTIGEWLKDESLPAKQARIQSVIG
eukprot:TRINITY_DN30815_c0_g1_i1.p1 TRINITY_DN30815_c0_g1~~TRINITY_DN30815_c0_g1_i1.p1  ORF type:complete len:266 (+),score=29.71 TRINITY_DN30815_c0_g1_i1:68-865(+)